MLQIVMACSVIVFSTGINSRSIPSGNLEIQRNRYRGTRWGRSANLEDFTNLENRQHNGDGLISASSLRRESRSAPEITLEVDQHRFRGTRWGRSVNPDEDLQVSESRYRERRPVRSYAGRVGPFRLRRSVEEDFVMAAQRNKRPGGGYSGTRWGR